jgi:hypothetical protein
VKNEVISGPEILLQEDIEDRCKNCPLDPPRPLDELVIHYVRVHGYEVTADYSYENAHCVELDKEGWCSERAMRLSARRSPARWLKVEGPTPDPANDAYLYRVAVMRGPKHTFEVRVSATGKTVCGVRVPDRIREWFGERPLPASGSTVGIPGDHFDPRFI